MMHWHFVRQTKQRVQPRSPAPSPSVHSPVLNPQYTTYVNLQSSYTVLFEAGHNLACCHVGLHHNSRAQQAFLNRMQRFARRPRVDYRNQGAVNRFHKP